MTQPSPTRADPPSESAHTAWAKGEVPFGEPASLHPRAPKITRLPGAFSRLAQDVAQVIGDRAPAQVLERVLFELETAAQGDPARRALRFLLESGCVTGPLLAWEGVPSHLMGIRTLAPEEMLARLDALVGSCRVPAVSCSMGSTVWVLLRPAARPRLARLLEAMPAQPYLAVGVDLPQLAAAAGEHVALEDLLDAGARCGRGGLVDDLAVMSAVRVDALLDAVQSQPALMRGPMDALLSHPENHAFALTLHRWFSCNQDTSATAVAMHLHTNTVRYRLRRAVEIAGVDFSDGNQRLLAEMQLRLWHRTATAASTCAAQGRSDNLTRFSAGDDV